MSFLKKWQFKRMDLAGLAEVLVMSGVFYWTGVRPMASRKEQARLQQVQLDGQRLNVADAAAQAEEVKLTLAQTHKAVDAIGVQLESAGSVNSRISRLMALAARHNLKIDEVHPSEPSYRKDYGSVPIVLNGSGNFANWSGFLHELSQSFQDTSVDAFQLVNKLDTPANPLQFHVSLTWYVSPPATTLAQK